MKIIDDVYGEVDITEQVLIDLINCDAIQRLKNVSQTGMPKEYYHKKFDYNRYEHSIGVFILLRKLNASLKEQIAGLLHDISHTAFSHVIDWVLGDSNKEDYQDNIFFEYLDNSNIPFILEKHGIDKNLFLNLEDFPLLEKEIPSLCADRIDYTLREIFKEGDGDLAKAIFSGLFVKDDKIVFNSKAMAELFSKEYVRLQREHWAGDQAKVRYFILSEILKRAIDKNIISVEDFYLSEEEILSLLKCGRDDFILKNLSLLREGFDVEDSEDGIELKKKFRYVDPEVFFEGKIFSLTELSPEYKYELVIQKENHFAIKKVRILNEH